MYKQGLLLLLVLLITTGCDTCSDDDCIGASPFLFKLSNQQGDNLLDTKAIRADQISIYSASNRNDSLDVSVFQHDNQSWNQAYLNGKVEEYTLEVKGVNAYPLTFDIVVSKGKCCTSSSIQEAYLDGQALDDIYVGWKNITIH